MNKFFLIITFSFLSAQCITAQDWIKVLDDVQSKNPAKIVSLPNGDLIIGGIINAAGEIYKQSGLVIRTDPSGNVIWETRIGNINDEGNYTHNERIEDLALSTDSAIVVVGFRSPQQANFYQNSDVFVAKIDLAGNEIWRHYFNWGLTDAAFGVTALPNGEVVVCGYTSEDATGGLNGFLFNMNAAGDIQWSKYYDADLVDNWLYGVTLTSDQHLVAVGTSQISGVGSSVWVIQTDLAGNVDWSHTYPGFAIRANAVVEHKNGHLGICGIGLGGNGGTDNLIMEIDRDGAVVWEEAYHANVGFTDELFDLIPCAEGGYVAAGTSGATAFDGYHILRVDADGDTLKTAFLYDGDPDADFAKSLCWASDGGLVVTGGRLAQDGDYDLVLTHFSDFGCTQPQATGAKEPTTIDVSVSPNPASDYIFVDVREIYTAPCGFTLFDAAGKSVLSHWSAQPRFSIDCRQIPAGTYFYTLQLTDGRASSGKLVIQP